MTEQMSSDENDARQVPAYDELMAIKARGQQEMEDLREEWRSKISLMSASEWVTAEQRFARAAQKISAQFGKSRRVNMIFDAVDGK